MPGEFRPYLFPHDHPRLAEVRGLDAYAYREAARTPDTFTGDLVAGWEPLYLNEFHGITENGTLREEVHRIEPPRPGEQAPVAEMVAAAEALLATLDDAGRARISHPVDAMEWQTWANPEFMQFDTGLRLEFQLPAVREAALGLMRASLSDEGYRLAHGMMLINGFLGETVELETILNEFSYNIALYGEPDPSTPWGWQLFGHHCAVNCLVVDGRMVLSPLFLGAEPNAIDDGPNAGVTSFTERIELGTALMAELPAELRRKATVYEQMVDPAMPPGRVHPGDERHLAGAFQDNRIIPIEGIAVADMPSAAQELVMAIIEQFVLPLPAGPRAARLREIREYVPQTSFSWIGGHRPGDVFYYRVQSPVIIAELDHHCGVFLDYRTPKPFHVHTVLRTPHGNDYGRAYLRQWRQKIPAEQPEQNLPFNGRWATNGTVAAQIMSMRDFPRRSRTPTVRRRTPKSRRQDSHDQRARPRSGVDRRRRTQWSVGCLELGRRGIEVMVVEPRTVLDPLRARAKTTSVRTMEHLRRWGIADRLRELAPLPVDLRTGRGVLHRPVRSRDHPVPQRLRAARRSRRSCSPSPDSRRRSRSWRRCCGKRCGSCPTVQLLIGWRALSITDGPEEVLR